VLLAGVTFTKSDHTPDTYKNWGEKKKKNHTETFLQNAVILIVLMVWWRECDAERLRVKHGAPGQFKRKGFPK